MERKELGKTGVGVPEIGLGTWEYQAGVEPLRKGIDLGAFLIDTAEAYGTEGIVGEAIKGIRDSVFVASKVSSNHFRRADLFKAADASLRQLKTDHIDLYQLHWPTRAVPIEDTMAAMEDLVEQGKVRFIGVCNFSVAELVGARKALTKHTIVSNQVSYSLLQRTIETPLLRFCQTNQITVIAYSPLARGIDNIRRKDKRNILARVAAQLDKTEAQVALNFCICRKPVIAIPKASTIDHVVENCNASGWRLSPEDIKSLERNFRRRGPLELAMRRAARRVISKLF